MVLAFAFLASIAEFTGYNIKDWLEEKDSNFVRRPPCKSDSSNFLQDSLAIDSILNRTK